MKRLLLTPLFVSLAYLAIGQNYETAKNLLLLMQGQKAKEEVDKGMSNTKYASKPEAWILKASIYSMFANDPKIKGTPEADKMMGEAETAWNKYKQMDPTLGLLTDLAYQNAPVNIYSGYFNSGYADYQAKRWQQGYEKFKKVVELSDLLIEKKIVSITVDTNSILLAGILAENAKQEDEAAKYYGRIADLKISSDGYESIYRFLVRYSYDKGNMANFEKYRALGKQIYPKSEYFNYDKIDFAVGLEEDFNKKIKALENILVTDPNNVKALQLVGEIIYDTLYSLKPGAVKPANADELEKKMVAALKKAGSLDPDNEDSFLFLGNAYMTKSIDLDSMRLAFADDLRKRTKPGVAVSKADQDKRDKLENDYAVVLDAAREPFEKAVAAYAKKTKLTNAAKGQYKKVVGYLADIAAFKKVSAKKNNAADLTKWTEEEKKWNDLYDTIK